MTRDATFKRTPLALAVRLGFRDLGGRLQGFRVFLACLIIGVAAIAGVGSLTAAIMDGLRDQGQVLLGGDVELQLTQRPAKPAERDALAASGKVSEVITLRSMARVIGNDERSLVEIKAVDAAYPLYGAVDLQGGKALPPTLAKEGPIWGAAMDPELAIRLDIDEGARLRIGDIDVEVRAIIDREPDRANDGFELAPRLMVAEDALKESGLLALGSLRRHSYRIKLPETVAPLVWRDGIETAFPEAGWRIRDREGSAPRIREFVGRVKDFLTLVGLTALVVGGVGVGNAVRSHLEGKTATIATLKTLGATTRIIFMTYLSQVMTLAALGVVLGLAAGAALPYLAIALAGDRLPIIPALSLYPLHLGIAAAYGILVTLAFTLWPLAAARDIPAARLFRQQSAEPLRKLRRGDMLAVGLAVAALLALPLLGSESPRMVFGFEVGAGLTMLLLIGLGMLIKRAAQRVPRMRRPVIRLALANLHRPGAPTGAVTLSLGLGLTLFTTLALVEGNLTRQIDANLPKAAPSFFFVDIQKNDIDAFLDEARAIDGIEEVRSLPYLRGRITHVAGVPSDEVVVDPGAEWVLRGDRGLTYSDSLPEDNGLAAGDWWPEGYAGPPEISFDAELAREMNLEPGDSLTIDVLGRTIEAPIRNLRRIDWGTLGINFAIMFDPATLKGAPHTYLATLKAKPEAEANAYRILTDAFPNVSAVRMKEVLDSVGKWLGDMGLAVRGAALITIVVGIFVLAGAMAASERHHIYDSVILKTLGGTRSTILKILLTEYAILGLVTGVASLLIGTGAACALVTQVMNMEWTFLPGTALLSMAAALVLTVSFGLMGTWGALRVRPARALRALA